MSNKPVDLVVANKMHEAMGLIATAESLQRKLAALSGTDRKIEAIIDHEQGREALARHLLCAISHECGIEIVLHALGSVKAPGTMADIAEGLQAVRDRQGKVTP
jgi:hypothetical protein